MNDVNARLETLLDRIDELESRSALRDLVSDYCLGFDQRDWDRFVSIWHADAVWDIGAPFGSFTGHDGIHAAVYDVLYPVWRETHHLASNLRLDFTDPDNATGVCNVDCMGANTEDVVQMISATYKDRFERRDGTWKIAQRQVLIHYFNPVPGVNMSAPA